MADVAETGLKWWIRYVIVPLIGGGGIIAIVVALLSMPPKAPDNFVKPPDTAGTHPSPPSISTSQRTSYKHTFEFAEPPLPFNVSRDDSKEPREQYRYGYTKLAFDKEQSERRLTVKRMKVTLHITNRKNWLCCDVWIFLGDRQFRANPEGFRGVTLDMHRIGEMMGAIPVKLKLVLTQSDQQVFPPGPIDLYAEYEFLKPVAQGNLGTSVKDASSTPFSLDRGVCAQVFVLTDFLVPNRPTDFDVNRLELEVEGFTDPSL